MSKEVFNNVTKKCISCGQEYEANEIIVLGMKTPFVLGGGNCIDCRQQLRLKEERREREEYDRIRSLKRVDWLRESGIPIKFQHENFKTFKINRGESIKKIYELCLRYIGNLSLPYPKGYESLVLYSDGVWGLGKSHLACAMGHDLMERAINIMTRCPVYFVSEPRLFRRIKNTFNRHKDNSETEEYIYEQLTKVPLLIIDDVGKEEVSDPRFVQRVLFSIIDGRYENMLPVVLTANLDLDDLARHLGGDRGNNATFDRLMEMTGNKFYEIHGTTFRDFRNRAEK